MEYAVIFGGRWGRDSQGLSGKGKIVIEEESVNLSGRQHTAIFFKVLLWLLSAMMVGNVMVVSMLETIFFFSGWNRTYQNGGRGLDWINIDGDGSHTYDKVFRFFSLLFPSSEEFYSRT